MAQRIIYELVNKNLDLTLDEIEIDEKINDVPEHLLPTEAMQERFMKNCVKCGIMKVRIVEIIH